MHPITVLQKIEAVEQELVGSLIEFDERELNCVSKLDFRDCGPFHYMKLQVLTGGEEDYYSVRTEAVDIEALLLLPPEQFTFLVHFWPDDAYNELLKECEENDDWYMDEGTGDWSRELDWNSPTILSFLEKVTK